MKTKASFSHHLCCPARK